MEMKFNIINIKSLVNSEAIKNLQNIIEEERPDLIKVLENLLKENDNDPLVAAFDYANTIGSYLNSKDPTESVVSLVYLLTEPLLYCYKELKELKFSQDNVAREIDRMEKEK